MQLVQLEREGWNFFCPSTGQPVFNDTGEPNASTVRGVWCHEVPDEPQLLCTELQAQWGAHLAIQDAADEAEAAHQPFSTAAFDGGSRGDDGFGHG